MADDYHFTVYGDDIKIGILTNDEEAMEAFKRDHPEWVSFPAEIRIPPRPPVIFYGMSRMRPRGDPRNHPPRYNKPHPDLEQATTPPMTRDDFRAMPPVEAVLAARRAERESGASGIDRFEGTATRVAATADAPTGKATKPITQAIPLLDKAGRPVIGGRGDPVSRPANGHDLAFYAKQGEADRALLESIDPEFQLPYLFGRLTHFYRRAQWDEQRLDGDVDQRFVDYATIAIGTYAAAVGIPIEDILGIEDMIARGSDFSNAPLSDTYRHLPKRNVQNTRTGYELYQHHEISE